MRLFVIADSSKRKAKPVGILLWEPDPLHEQGRFSLELSSECNAADLPLSLEFCARTPGRHATPEESESWVKSRIVPENRHNIGEVLHANGLVCYDEVALLTACQGRSSDDDFLAYEITFTDEGRGLETLLDELSSSETSATRADRIIAALSRQRQGGEVHYAFVALPAFEETQRQSAAQLVGSRIRELRLSRRLTQKQLAARAGITQTVLSRVESGNGNPTLALLEEIASALGESLTVSIG